jgi:hypothetical protein
MGKGFWIGTIIVVIILGITAGIIVHVYGDERTERATLKQANELARMKEANLNDKANKNGRNNGKNGNGENNSYYDNNENSNDVENSVILKTSSGEEKTTPNTLIIFESYYSKCGHSKIRSEKIANEYVNKTKEEMQKIYCDWEIRSFSSDRIELFKNENSLCGNHYIVKEENGYVTVYNINKDGQEVLSDKTDISTKYLPKDDNDLLKKGIKANSTSQLEQILADFE